MAPCWVTGVVIGCALLLAACQPDDIAGVKLSESGAPVVVNCGTFFRGIEVYDGDTDRLVWSAEESPGSSENGVGDVVIGVLPSSEWTEGAPFIPSPTPTNWRFVIDQFGYSTPRTLTALNSSLSTDQVLLFESGEKVDVDTYRGKTCGYDPPISQSLQRTVLMVAVAVAVLIAGVFISVRAWRRRQRPS